MSTYTGSKASITAIKKAACIPRSPRQKTPGPIAFLTPKPGQKIHPVHAAWDDRDAYTLARECFLAWVSVENVYAVTSLIETDPEKLDDIISRAGRDTATIRHLAMSVRRGQSYLRNPVREAALKLLADRYPASVSIGELCAMTGTQGRAIKDFLQRYPVWFVRTARGMYRLADEDIRDAVYQRVLDAQRARETNEYIEQRVRSIGFFSDADEFVEFQRYIESPSLAGTPIKDAYDAGVLQEALWAAEGRNLEPDAFELEWDDYQSPLPKGDDEFAWLVEPEPGEPLIEPPPPEVKPEIPDLTPVAPPKTVSVDSFLAQFQEPVKASEMYKKYKEWCRANGLESVSQTRFGSLVRSAGFRVRKTKTHNVYEKVEG